MKDLAPEIARFRLLIEGFFSDPMDESRVSAYLLGIADELGLKVYGAPTIHSPAGIGSDHNQGYDAFVPLIDSGISLYIWSQQCFFSTLIYSCKSFDAGVACNFTQAYFRAPEIEHRSF